MTSQKRARWQKPGTDQVNQSFAAGQLPKERRDSNSLLVRRKPDQLDVSMMRVPDAETALALKRMDFKCEWDAPRYVDLASEELDQRHLAHDAPDCGFFKRIKQQQAEQGNNIDEEAAKDEHFDWFQNHHHFVIYDKPTERQKQFFVERRMNYYRKLLPKEVEEPQKDQLPASQDSLGSNNTAPKSIATTNDETQKKRSKKRNYANFSKTAKLEKSPSAISISSYVPAKRVKQDRSKSRDLLNQTQPLFTQASKKNKTNFIERNKKLAAKSHKRTNEAEPGVFGQTMQLFGNMKNKIQGFFFGHVTNDQKPGTVKKAKILNPIKIASSADIKNSRSAKNDKENLTSSFHDLSIESKGANVNFAYEPQLFTRKEVAEATGGKKWHELSPGSRVAVNKELKERNERDKKFGGLKDISIDRNNFFGN